MENYARLIAQLKSPEVIRQLNNIYGTRNGMLVRQTLRYSRLLKKHEELVGCSKNLKLISAPGRTEIGGNHTDHNKGKVLAAAINLDALAAVTPREDNTVRIFSDGYAPLTLNLEELSPLEEEKGTTAALVRGVAAWMKEHGFQIGGFDAVINSTVAAGSGLSSSASVEVLFCAILDNLYNGDTMDYKSRGICSQFAENVYFGKPSGLLDQMTSSAGGLVYMDFKGENPEVRPLAFDFAARGYALVVVNSGGSHDNLTADYAAVPKEMKQVAAFFGEEVLRPVLPERFYQSIPQIREKLGPEGDRAILRAAHFFEENRRVVGEVSALESNDIPAFLKLIIESGRSSFCYLQNIFPDARRQELSLALMLGEHLLNRDGAWRVHGGGFAGTTLNFVPQDRLEAFLSSMEAVFGAHSCDVLDIRPVGPACITLE